MLSPSKECCLSSGGRVIRLLPTKEVVGLVRKCGKRLRELNRKFELKQKDISLRGGSDGLLKVHLHRKLEEHGCLG